MFDMFSFIEPIVDQEIFIAQLEEIIESPEASKYIQGNPYELHLLLQSLKKGSINFEQFLTQAKAWAI
jgi:hypothetical protein